jgi:cytochrome c peroxidase
MTRAPKILVVATVFGVLLAGAAVLKINTGVVAAEPQLRNPSQQVTCRGEPCDSVARGLHAFRDRRLKGLGGNGRSCADCHMPSDSFQLSPANAEARFQRLLQRRAEDPEADDPLFRAIDADDFRVNGDAASDFSNLRQNGLIRVTFPLPSTMRLVDPATGQVTNETFVDVWRAVPTVQNVKLTGPQSSGPVWPRGPNTMGGFQYDARFGTLQDQALGALITHAEVQGLPSQQFLDDVSAFQLQLFTSPSVRVLAEAIDAGTTPLPDPDPPLDELEQQGKAVFVRACTQCHGGPGQSSPGEGINRFGSIQAQCPRPVDGPTFPGYTGTPRWSFKQCPPRLARNVRLYEVVRPNGQVTRRPTSDPGRSLLTGFASLGAGPPPLVPPPLDDWQALDTPQLRNLAKTAPYFHNNSADTLDDMLDHYDQFFKFVRANSPPPPAPVNPVLSTDGVHFDRPPTAAERAALIAYLKKL